MHRIRIHQLMHCQRFFSSTTTVLLTQTVPTSAPSFHSSNGSAGTSGSSGGSSSTTNIKGNKETPSVGNSHSDPMTSIAPGPYRRVGNIFIVHCNDHPFKHSWEVNRMLRDLRLEFKGQTTIHPDIPAVRKRLWRVRHIVNIDMMDLDEAKTLIGVPEHIHFSDLMAQIPASFGRVRAVQSPVIRSKMNFMRLRRMRLRDVLHRDALELRLLEEKRKTLATATIAAVQDVAEKVSSPDLVDTGKKIL